MPTYDYKCLECGNDFEVFQSMKDALVKTCPKCGGKVKRLIGTGSGLIFKGSGFYATDYKKQSPSSASGQTPCSGCKDAPKCSQEKSKKK
ncbi:MAG: zinc ribbon domain-containing protein [Candidatus Omnitrophica bacterium]|nr:zinc ribbon domain-containing protein [Candidatus Omnitrophota bacterium]MBU2045040.1 zinc ribbon domain-containing protein [Candidatus Omnitrophota bacterium]MBU2251296.1 zinc ribbon domain-containing protein [Candidatus Omnitrophota bacterium]MBU2266223.1 zinc ribbon domain-containing protein [Candidatus Omnitrophota bacterium]MBU2474264.1 zinc ribbon domain-containing protein [Candidatus Omnitrophota bacterium]